MHGRDCDADELAAWLRLLETPDVGRAAARRLLAAFGSPQAVFRAGVAARTTVVGGAAARALAEPALGQAGLLRDTLAWLRADGGPPRHIVTLGDPDYPAMLLQTADPPLLIYAIGRVELLRADSLAIVGSRHATPQGRLDAGAFAAQLGNAGLTIVSGLALGIDGAAHAGAIDTTGSTVAVVGTGLDQVYPRRHAELARRVAERGLIVGEYALGTPPLPPHFPQRNRIIAGLTRGTLVVEANLQSGSLITARLAVEAGREVFAIPGSIHAPQSRGCHALIKQGAKLVETAQDVMEELGMAASVPAPAIDAGPAHPLLEAMGHDPIGLDELVARTGWSAAELNARLLDLELAGRVARLPGQRFQRLGRG
ncbi:DNA-processing protein DprA [uncultured Piscinibacter sp.]|uniref:DNA-processing protein DprA n=1 Tax=uncultured Piscinibacter sp. TaxID=1131835 RepID=UPI00260C4872|nr:DNA-processing protein DprA [uncultured Piscinibacter sp.]